MNIPGRTLYLSLSLFSCMSFEYNVDIPCVCVYLFITRMCVYVYISTRNYAPPWSGALPPERWEVEDQGRTEGHLEFLPCRSMSGEAYPQHPKYLQDEVSGFPNPVISGLWASGCPGLKPTVEATTVIPILYLGHEPFQGSK